MQGDLTKVDEGAFWTALREAMGKDGLLTYRYLGRKSQTMHDVPYDSMKIRSDMRNAAGGIMAAPLAIATASTGGFTDFNAVPAPVTAGLRIIDPGHDVREVRMRTEVLHMGRSMGFSRTVVTDAANPDRVIALTDAVGIKLGEAPQSGADPFPIEEDMLDRPDLPRLHEVFGGYRLPDGVWELPEMTAANRSTSGSLHLGPIHIIFEAAATEAAAAAAGTNQVQVEDWDVLFIARGINGPFAVEARAVPAGKGKVACTMLLKDRGKDNRTVASCTAIYSVPPA